MLGRSSSRPKNFFRKLVVNGVSNSKAAIQNDCLMRLYDADAELKAISTELDSFDGKKDPIRCNLLVNQLRTAQDKVISLLFQLMDDCNCERAPRDYRMKFPDEILLSEGSESLNGQIWFGAECLSAGSNILNHTKESTMLRPMAKTLTTHLDSLRNDLRDLVIDGGGASRINQALIKKMVSFDNIFATFEYEYVRTMLPIRTVAEIEKLQEVAVLFSETLIDCVKRGLIKQDDIDEFQPIVMIAIPRLAIVRGLLYKNENPIYTKHKSQMCSLFQPFHGPLHSIRRLLRGLSSRELFSLEKMLANDQTAIESPLPISKKEHQKSEIIMQQQQTQGNDNNIDTYRTDNDSEEAGTSNSHYSNVLMDGLQYPIGPKRGDGETDFMDQTQQQQENCCFDCHASSSKSISTNQATSSPTSSPHNVSPSTSSSLSNSSLDQCKRCRVKSKTDSPQRRPNCDKNCCVSPSGSDSQLEKLDAEFSPAISNQISQGTSGNVTSNYNDNVGNGITLNQIDSGAILPTTVPLQQQASSEDEALLEKLFMKQAQQLLHRLFVAISGVADQLQSNFASDLRFILKHIFSSENSDDMDNEDEGGLNANESVDLDDDEDSEERESSNNDHSDSSLTIEQGIEAREVANLIDLESGYSPNSPYDYDNSNMRFLPPMPTTTPLPPSTTYINHSDNRESELIVSPNDHYSHSSTLLYGTPVTQSQTSDLLSSTNPRAFRQSEARNNEDLMNDYTRAVDQTELIYESRTSPNEASIMDDVRHQQLIQQNLQSNLTISRSARSSSHRGSRNDGGSGGVERRSSRHHHGSRSRRQRGPPPVWVPDQLVAACNCCQAPFTLFRRRHHCRACGQIFCAECSKYTRNLNCWGYKDPVRVCESCFNQP